MFDIVAPDNDKLAMTVQIVGVYDAEPGLARAGAAAQPGAKHRPHQKHKHKKDNQSRSCADEPKKNRVIPGEITEELHMSHSLPLRLLSESGKC